MRETVQNTAEDENGYDMFVKTVDLIGIVFKMGGKDNVLPVQIKSANRSAKEFFRKYSKHKRFFNVPERQHQFILCGLADEEVILADIVGQMVVHAHIGGISENRALEFLEDIEDSEAVIAYRKNKTLLSSGWYGKMLPT